MKVFVMIMIKEGCEDTRETLNYWYTKGTEALCSLFLKKQPALFD